ncbi:STAS domain-containing protein [Nocardia salmonicida]
MDPRFRHSEVLFPVVEGDPSTPARLRAELHRWPTVTILSVHGEIDAYTQNRWRRILDAALSAAEESGRLVVDVDDAYFIGCRTVLDLAHCAQQGVTRGIQVSAIDPVPSVLDRIITITGLTEWLPVLTDLTDIPTAKPPRRQAGPPIDQAVLAPESS